MTRRKSDVVRHFSPRFASRETMAYLLDMSVDTFDRLVAAGKIEQPCAIGGIIRWHVEQVFGKLEGYGIESDEETEERRDIRSGTARVFGTSHRRREPA